MNYNLNFDTVGIQNIDMTVNGAQAGVLLAKASGTQMKDVLITDAKITTEQQYVGGLIGHAENVTITKVFADSEVHIPYNKSPEYMLHYRSSNRKKQHYVQYGSRWCLSGRCSEVTL